MIDDAIIQRRLAAVELAQEHAAAIGLVCPVCTLKIAKSIDTFLETGEVTGDHMSDDDAEVEEFIDDAYHDPDDNVVSIDQPPKKKH
jgi:hypothetical protein